jgi:hypothetical protein
LLRDVDLVEHGQITNPYRLRSIKRDLTLIYDLNERTPETPSDDAAVTQLP